MRRVELLGHAARDYPNAIRARAASVRARAVPAGYGAGEKRPVVVIPGVYETWHFLRAAADLLSELGHPIHVMPALRYNTQPIPTTAARVAAEIAALDLHDVAIVAHSKGGLIGKHLMARDDPDGRVDRLVAVATPFAGSQMARWMPGRTLRAFLPADPVIRSLAAERALNARITSIYPRFDPHIPEGSRLEGARNIEIASIGHFGVLLEPDTLAAIAEAVER